MSNTASNFVVNIIHRPELSPEYSKNALGDNKDQSDESLDIFLFQQETAHKNGLKTTIQITYASLFSDKIIEIAKKHHKEFGDEIGLSLLGLPCDEFKKKYKTDDFCIWMFDKDTKMQIIDDAFSLFYKKFGFYPQSTGSYFLDAFTINYIKEKYPMVKCAIATCWEEGPKAYHTCNNSWYTFMDGGPWNPWIPSKINSHCPAKDLDDDSGIVAIPHLSRDLMACFDGNGSNFGTHPQNVLRGMIYYKDENGHVDYPYLFNLIDQYRHLEKYNGYAYNMMFVGPGWLNKSGRWEAPYELLKQSYEDAMEYYGNLKKEGKLIDMTMSEFATFYRKTHKSYTKPEVALWKDILYGNDKQYFWYIDPNIRTCLDFNQGGAMIDLRPLVGRIPQEVGIGTKNVYDASYPYLIQINYRAGYFTHYAGAGTIKSCKVTYHNQSVDLCLCKTFASYEKVKGGIKITANPVTIEIDGLEIVIKSTFIFEEGSSKIITKREILNDLHGEKVELTEYFTGGFSTNEYQLPLNNVELGVNNKKIKYNYKGRKITLENDSSKSLVAFINIKDLYTKVTTGGNSNSLTAEEGIAFSPIYKLIQTKEMTGGKFETWLKLEKVN